jgi:hypothetical protein
MSTEGSMSQSSQEYEVGGHDEEIARRTNDLSISVKLARTSRLIRL